MLDKDISVDGNENNVVHDVKNSTINIGMTYTEVKSPSMSQSQNEAKRKGLSSPLYPL